VSGTLAFQVSYRKADDGAPDAPKAKGKEEEAMTVILVLVTFLVFVVLDWVLHRAEAKSPVREAVPENTGEIVDGFLVPAEYRYHAGHGWVDRERPNRMRVGIDEFAAMLAGAVDGIELPKPGQWIRQGQRVFSFLRGGERAEMVSPIEGEVVEVNQEVLRNPELLREDPYGKGWLLAVHVPDEEGTLRNLLPINLVADWMRENVERFYQLQPQLAGATAADGGRPTGDLWKDRTAEEWKQTVSKFFLTA